MSLKTTTSLSKTSALALSTPRLSTPLLRTPNPIIPTLTRPQRQLTTTPQPSFSEHGEWDPASPLRKPYIPTWATTSQPPATPQHYITPTGLLGVVVSHGGRWSTRGGGFNPRLALDRNIVAAVLASP
ncbi:MAG: hypothetical protein Q9195_009653, partial [Heterodermia aff. obscurata]